MIAESERHWWASFEDVIYCSRTLITGIVGAADFELIAIKRRRLDVMCCFCLPVTGIRNVELTSL